MIPSPKIPKEPVFNIEYDKKDPTIRKFYMDGFKNNMYMMKSTDKTMTIWLMLKSENYRKREIGTITKSTRTMFIRRDRAKHLFVADESYGFCYHILRYQDAFDFVSLSDGFQHWKIPVQYILDNGNVRDFRYNGGYEIQIFISLRLIEKFEIKPEEGRRL